MSNAFTMIKYKIDEWTELRAQFYAMEKAEHPDIIDKFGRSWQWVSGTLYTHDDTLAFPMEWIANAGLPTKGLADKNANYAKLCGICRHERSE